jgi:hypothetical protein
LDPDNMLVVGARGTGKSFWWHTLLSDRARAALTPQTPAMQRGTLKVSAGWSEQSSLAFPDKRAAEDTGSNAARALDWRAIHSGVRKASEIRVTELAEDFPWTKPAMDALEGLNVPCERKELVARWVQENVMQTIEKEPEGRINKGSRLGVQGLLNDLVDVGVLEVRPDDRFNIPDVYRVGFGLKRRGGVRPVS